MKTKTFRAAMEIKADGQPGEFRAVFSTFNVIDLDGDVTLPGAFKDGAAVRISYWGHRWQDLPVGRGVIRQDEKQAWVDGKFFLDTQAGKETYQTVKNLGELQEWSYGYEVLRDEDGQFENQEVRFLKELEVPEVSPVMLGAGIDTHTENIKSFKGAIGVHHTPVTDDPLDKPEAEKRLPNEAAALRAFHAWVDAKADPDLKGSYKFGHHFVDEGGKVHGAAYRTCVVGIAELNGARGGTTIPDGDKKGVWNHLAAHIKDFGKEPPELKSADDHGQDPPGGTPRNPTPSVIAAQIQIELLEG